MHPLNLIILLVFLSIWLAAIRISIHEYIIFKDAIRSRRSKSLLNSAYYDNMILWANSEEYESLMSNWDNIRHMLLIEKSEGSMPRDCFETILESAFDQGFKSAIKLL